MSEPAPDHQLMLAYRAGDEQAATELFDRYYRRLIGLVRSSQGWRLRALEGSTDVAQSVLRSFFAQIRKESVAVGEGDSLWPLLATITLNKVRNRGKFYERERRDPSRQVPLQEGLDPLEQGPSPDDAAILRDLVDRLLGAFSDRRRRIVELILEGHPVQDIAAAVGTTERTIYNTRQAAAKILAQVLSVE